MSGGQDAEDFAKLSKRVRNWEALVSSDLAESWEPGELRRTALQDMSNLIDGLLYPPRPPEPVVPEPPAPEPEPAT